MLVKFTSILILLTVFNVCISAKEITEEKALLVASEFLQSNDNAAWKVHAKRKLVKAKEYDLLFIYNVGDNDGFVIVAADDCAHPILAYSTEGKFDTDSISPAAKAIIENYQCEIREARENNSKSLEEWSTSRHKAVPIVNALIKTQWNQWYPYNLQCPTLCGKRCATGCVATTLAQIMNYWEWPASGHGENNYVGDYGIVLKSNFSKPFRWDLMKSSYKYGAVLTDDEADAIGHLMSQCGIAVSMAYWFDQSGASDSGESLVHYFDYDSLSLAYHSITNYTVDSWLKIIKTELDKKRPIIYTSSSHEYICDGYDDANFIHINFGWGGGGDGFYQLFATNSYLKATYQSMVTGIKPNNTPKETIPQKVANGRLKMYTSSNEIESGIQVSGYFGFDVLPLTYCFAGGKAGLADVDENGNIKEIIYSVNLKYTCDYAKGPYEYFITQLVNKGDTTRTYRLEPIADIGNGWQRTGIAKAFCINVKPVIGGTPELFVSGRTTYIYNTPNNRVSVFIKSNNNSTFVGDVKVDIYRDSRVVHSKTFVHTAIPASGFWFSDDSVSLLKAGNYAIIVNCKSEKSSDFIQLGSEYALEVSDKVEQMYISNMSVDKGSPDDRTYAYMGGDKMRLKVSIKNASAATRKGYLEIYSHFETDSILSREYVEMATDAIYDKELDFTVPEVKNVTYGNLRARLICQYANGTTSSITIYFDGIKYGNKSGITLMVKPHCQLRLSGQILINNVTQDTCLNRRSNKFRLPIDLTTSDNSFYGNLILRLYNQEGVTVAESSYPAYVSNANPIAETVLRIGDNVPNGEYTLKLFTSVFQREEPIIDTTGVAAKFKMSLVDPIVNIIHDATIVDEVIYSFDSNTHATIVRGEKSSLKYCVSNPDDVDFNGTLAVFAYDIGSKLVLNKVSEDLPVVIKRNSGSKCYGTIDVTLPSNVLTDDYSHYFILLGKGKGETEYHLLGNSNQMRGTVYLLISDHTSIESVTSKPISVTPLLTTGNLTISGTSFLPVECKIFETSGRCVMRITAREHFDVSSLDDGLFLLQLNVNGKKYHFKFIKQ